MQFWYHAYGNDVGMFIVYIRAAGTSTEIFRDDWTGIDEWMVAEATVSSVLDYQVCYKSQIPLLHFINKINCSNVE
jgi:hypothetical protein